MAGLCSGRIGRIVATRRSAALVPSKTNKIFATRFRLHSEKEQISVPSE